jgi:thioesterase domain-containing protein
MLANIMIFQDTMIVTEEMAEYGHDWMEEEHEEEMYHQNNEYENHQMIEEMQSLEDFLELQEENDEQLEAQREAIEEKKRKRDDQLTDFWNHMVDKFHDKES